MIDDHHFGSEYAFKSMYVGPGRSIASFLRFASDYSRYVNGHPWTVQEAGHINYTNRIAKTFDFEAGSRRMKLYESVSAYLQRENTIGLARGLIRSVLSLVKRSGHQLPPSHSFSIRLFSD